MNDKGRDMASSAGNGDVAGDSRRWTISNLDFGGTVIGPQTGPVEVRPASEVERLREDAEQWQDVLPVLWPYWQQQESMRPGEAVARLLAEVESSRRPAPWPDGARSWPMIETARAVLVPPAGPAWECAKCGRRRAAIELSDGVLTDEETRVCAPCLLDAVQAYPEHDE